MKQFVKQNLSFEKIVCRILKWTKGFFLHTLKPKSPYKWFENISRHSRQVPSLGMISCEAICLPSGYTWQRKRWKITIAKMRHSSLWGIWFLSGLIRMFVYSYRKHHHFIVDIGISIVAKGITNLIKQHRLSSWAFTKFIAAHDFLDC